MVQKRKSATAFEEENVSPSLSSASKRKKSASNDATVDIAPHADASSSSKKKSKASKVVQDWHEIVLDGEDKDEVPIYDDCNDVRRKIHALMKQPGFKITPWLKEIGNINYNSYSRFMKATGPSGGAENGLYIAGYKYFEKVRIASGKPKSAKRLENEGTRRGGFPLEDRKHMWVLTKR